jgi:hypothetical protein
MWIVYYWANCSIVGEYLERMRFDDFADALTFARANNGTMEAMR